MVSTKFMACSFVKEAKIEVEPEGEGNEYIVDMEEEVNEDAGAADDTVDSVGKPNSDDEETPIFINMLTRGPSEVDDVDDHDESESSALTPSSSSRFRCSLCGNSCPLSLSTKDIVEYITS